MVEDAARRGIEGKRVMARVPALVDRFGHPIERKALTAEIAGPTLTGVRSPIAGYPADGLNPYRLASILREADQGEPLRYFELAETIEERDLHYAGVLGTRKRSVAQIDITVDAAGDDARSVAHADMVREWLTRDELQDELFDILDAIGKGQSATEIVWDTSSGQWRPDRLEWRDPRWFTIDRADGRTPLLRTDAGNVPLPGAKFIVTVIRAKSGLPVRSGIARLAAWSWMFKAFTQRDWAIFTQTYGQPIRVGKYPAGATEEQKETLFRAVANIAGDCAAIIPDGMLIEFVEAKSVGASANLYLKRADWLDQQVSKAVLGQTATTDAIAGGHAVGREHRQVQEDIERADAKAVSAVLNRDLVRPWVDLEFGPQAAYPRLRIARPEKEDLKQLTDSLTRLVPLGLRVGMSEVRDRLGFADPADGEEVLAAPRPKPAPGVKPPGAEGEDEPVDDPDAEEARQAAEPSPPRDAIDTLADEAERRAQPAADALVDAIKALVLNAESLGEVRDGLLALRPAMPAAELARHLQAAVGYAELTGRAEITDG